MKKLFTLLAMLMMMVTSSFAQDYLKFYLPDSPSDVTTNIYFEVVVKSGTLTYRPSFQYSTDGTNWTDYNYKTQITVTSGSAVYFKAKSTNTTVSAITIRYIHFVSDGTIYAGGNIMSLLDETCKQTTIPDYAFCNMFSGCTGLVSAPDIPATTVGAYSCAGMFAGCTSLTTAPELRAQTLAASCYANMFKNCTSLQNLTVDFTDWDGAEGATTDWLSGVPSTGTLSCPTALDTSTAGTSNVPEGWTVDKFTRDPLCITAEGSNVTVQFIKNGTFASEPSIVYSTDGTNFTDYTYGDYIYLNNAGDKVYFMAKDKNATFSESEYAYLRLRATGTKAAVSGNVMSLLDNKCQQTSVPDYAFHKLFVSDCITSAPELPATTLGRHCYHQMFSMCTNLTAAPALPATTLADYCYDFMFDNCTSLTTAPVLPATELAPYCYYYMFSSCSNLTAAPVLPATTLADHCYGYMFYGCTGLNSISVNFTDWNTAGYSTSSMLGNVAATGKFICPGSLEVKTGDNYIPEGWTVGYNMTRPDDCLCFTAKGNNTRICFKKIGDNWTSTVPSLVYSTDGKVFYDYSYGTDITLSNIDDKVYFMAKDQNATFSESSSNYIACTSLNYIFAVSGNIMSLLDNTCQRTSVPDYAFYELFEDCGYMQTAPELPATTLGSYCYYYMFAYCEKLQAAPELPAKVMAPYCYHSMFYDCKTLTSAPALPATTLAMECYHTMFANCSALTTAPELPATDLVSGCYTQIFSGCSKVGSIKVGFTQWNADRYTYSWLSGVAETGTFICPAGLEQKTGTSYIPEGWTVCYNMTRPDDCLCITAEASGVALRFIKEEFSGNTFTNLPSIVYSTDGTTFSDYTYGTNIILSNAGDNVYFMAKDANETFSESKYAFIQLLIFNGNAAASGNVMSLLDNTCQRTSVPDYAFYELFCGNEYLTSAPELPATTLGKYCYGGMFSDCDILTAAPALPSTTLAGYCYENMFSDCTSLTAAPDLPASKLADHCYYHMFDGCKSLSSIKVGFTGWNEGDKISTAYWLNGVAETGTFTCPAELDQTKAGTDYIPEGWLKNNFASESILGIVHLIDTLKKNANNPAYRLDDDDDVDIDDLNILINRTLKK